MSSKLARLFTSVDARIQKNMSDQMKAKWNHEAGSIINLKTIIKVDIKAKKKYCLQVPINLDSCKKLKLEI